MLKCNNCNRIYKKKYKLCPACNSTNFAELENQNNIVLKYDEYISIKKKTANEIRIYIFSSVAIIGVITCIISFNPFISQMIKSYSRFGEYSTFIYSFGLMMLNYFNAIIYMKIKKKRISKLMDLAKKGVLVKNLNYEIVSYKNKTNKYQIKISYMDELGAVKTLFSDVKKSTIRGLNNLTETADILIDPNDDKNYYIDFEIY